MKYQRSFGSGRKVIYITIRLKRSIDMHVALHRSPGAKSAGVPNAFHSLQIQAAILPYGVHSVYTPNRNSGLVDIDIQGLFRPILL